jgi:thiosulfate/3-mercaptopyruvate sulfurtransferase
VKRKGVILFATLIESTMLANHLEEENWIVVDCRFSLAEPESGRQAYERAHIPGAVYAHLDNDLSGPPVSDHGRHPLPTPAALAALFGRLGIEQGTQVVVYDDFNGAIASRLWWMLRYMGYESVAVLNGGWQAWQASGLPTTSGVEQNEGVLFSGAPRETWLVRLADVGDLPLLVDSRAAERYRGEIEPLDPQAGHIPGAVNFFYQRNWDENGRYLEAEKLREQFEQLLGDTPVEQTTFYCGSGVTSCANLLALAHAGMGDARMYTGSWSEWCRDPSRPIATGE